jgi:hypothetical protein
MLGCCQNRWKGIFDIIINWMGLFSAQNQYLAADKMAQHYTGASDWVQCGEKPAFSGELWLSGAAC